MWKHDKEKVIKSTYIRQEYIAKTARNETGFSDSLGISPSLERPATGSESVGKRIFVIVRNAVGCTFQKLLSRCGKFTGKIDERLTKYIPLMIHIAEHTTLRDFFHASPCCVAIRLPNDCFIIAGIKFRCIFVVRRGRQRQQLNAICYVLGGNFFG